MKMVVRTAADAEVLGFVAAARGSRVDVVELEPSPRGAALAVRAPIVALLAIAGEDLSARRARDAAAPRMLAPPLPLRALRFRTTRLLETLEKRIERAFDHHRQVAARVRVHHEIARAFE